MTADHEVTPTLIGPCAHCGRTCGDYAGGYGGINEVQVCHPNDPVRPDCFRLVTVYKHQLLNCPKCTPKWTVATAPEPPDGTRIEFQEFGSPGGDMIGIHRDDASSAEAGWPIGDGGKVWCEYGRSVPITWVEVLDDPRLAAAVEGQRLELAGAGYRRAVDRLWEGSDDWYGTLAEAAMYLENHDAPSAPHLTPQSDVTAVPPAASPTVETPEAVEGAHTPYTDDGLTYCGWYVGPGVPIVDGCGAAWPCPTVQARRGGEVRDGD